MVEKPDGLAIQQPPGQAVNLKCSNTEYMLVKETKTLSERVFYVTIEPCHQHRLARMDEGFCGLIWIFHIIEAWFVSGAYNNLS